MRVVIFSLCAILAVGVFGAMFLSIWSTRHSHGTPARLRQSVVTELVWAAIPCLMFFAAAVPAAIVIMTSND
jgi:heme/copper-type cytochrome/quinol oxidase subunit 2